MDLKKTDRASSGNLEESIISKSGPMMWIQQQIEDGVNPRDVIQHLIPDVHLPDYVSEVTLWRIVWEIITEPPPRKRLANVNSMHDVRNLIRTCKNILVLTGAGVSVSCGIPDFRSRDGVYARLSRDYPDLPDPQAMFDINYFRSNPWPFFKFAKEIFPGQFVPSLSHRFVAHLDRIGVLLRNYTQNIDTLEQVAGIVNVVQCHGSFASATCMNCKRKVDSCEIRRDIFEQKIPYCSACVPSKEDELNIMKPDIVFFGENLPSDFYSHIESDKGKADLLIVIGSSLKVRPVSLIPNLVPADIPQILINREPLSHVRFDIELLGNSDDILCELCRQLGGEWLTIAENYRMTPVDSEVIRLLRDNGDVHSEESLGSSSAVSREVEEPPEKRPRAGIPAHDADSRVENSRQGDCPRGDSLADRYAGDVGDDVCSRSERRTHSPVASSEKSPAKESEKRHERHQHLSVSRLDHVSIQARGGCGAFAYECRQRDHNHGLTDDKCTFCDHQAPPRFEGGGRDLADAAVSDEHATRKRAGGTQRNCSDADRGDRSTDAALSECGADLVNSSVCGVSVPSSSVMWSGSQQGCSCRSSEGMSRWHQTATVSSSSGVGLSSDLSLLKGDRANRDPAHGEDGGQTCPPRTLCPSALETPEGEEIYYVRIPPNRYVFHGAELAFTVSESDTSSESGSDEQDDDDRMVTDALSCPAGDHGRVDVGEEISELPVADGLSNPRDSESSVH